MRRTVAVAVYEHRVEARVTWWPLVPRGRMGAITGTSEVRMREDLGKLVREALREVEPAEQEHWDAPPGLRLHRVHLDLTTKGPQPKKVAGPFPLIVEPRWFGEDDQRLLAYHPHQPDEWFDAADVAEAELLAPHFARKAWASKAAEDLEALKVTGKDRLIVVSFSVEPRSLLDRKRKPDERTRAGLGRTVRRVLGDLAVDQTARAIDRTLPIGVPRQPYRGQLGRLLGGDRPRSTILVGRPGSGRSTLLARWVADRLEEDGYQLHRNTDRIHHVWRLSGKRLIAGMQYFGDWEERCLDVVEDARKHQGILWFDDLHLFGRLGVTRQSERSFADFFRGPVQRGEVAMIGTATREQLARLEDDAPAFAGLFTRIGVEPTTTEQTRALLLAEVRRLEAEHRVAIHPFAPRTVAELAGALFPWTAAPGAAVELMRKLVAARATLGESEEGPDGSDRLELGPREAVALAARETGLPEHLITLEKPLDPAAVEAHFAARVIGQHEAVAVATEVVLKVRAGLTDAARPLGVYLFTGPTGTGKTELATALAEYLYGDPRRLLRFDMSELSGPDAVARLIGDRFSPEGLLTQRIREQPFAVVLLDEIEKAHPSVLALLLQLFDEGRLTDAAGDVASFRHAVIVMTSNLGAKVAAPIGFGDGAAAIMGDIARAVRDFFPPELWNRIDRVVRFRPLTPEVAARVVDKELAKLLGRRGLRERNVFVYPGRAIRERAVAQAFDPRYGARTVKRWLEDHVATALAEALTVAPPSRMAVARLREDGASVAVDLEVLAEADTLPGTYPLAELLELAASALVPHADAMADEIDQVLAGDALRAQEEAARASPRADELRYFVEAYRDELAALRQTLVGERRRVVQRLEDSEDEIVHDLSQRQEIPFRSAWDRGRPPAMVSRFDRRSLGPRRKHALDQRDALAALARARLLIDHLGELSDPVAHAVTIELAMVGRGRELSSSLFSYLVSLPHDEVAARARDGSVLTQRPVNGGAVAHTVVIVRDLLARPAYADEHGSHVFQSLTHEPEILRVSVTAGAVDPQQRIREHQAAMTAFEEAVAAGSVRAVNPEPLLPVVRVLSLAGTPRPGSSWTAEVEDFVTGFVGTIAAPSSGEIVRTTRHLRWSRRGGPR